MSEYTDYDSDTVRTGENSGADNKKTIFGVETMVFLSPQHILSVFRRNWLYISIFAMLGALLGLFWNDLVIKPVFVSRCSLYAGYAPGRQNTAGNEMDSVFGAASGDRQADVILLHRSLALGTLLVGDYREIMTSQMVQGEVKRRVAQELEKRNIKPSGFSVAVDYAKTTRLIKITGRSTHPLEAQLAASETTAVFKKAIEDILLLDNVRLIDEANYPYFPDIMNRKLRTLVGILIGAFIGLIFFIMLDYFDQTVKTTDDVRAKLNCPVVGVIPLSEEAIRNSTDDRRSNLGMAGFTENNIAEAFRLVRTNLQYLALPKNGRARVFMLTSTVAAEGKSSCAVNLAMITAQSGKRVLVIDADLRRPSQHKILDVRNDVGLSEVICGAAEFEDAVKRNVRNTSLDLLCSGAVPGNPSELLMSKEFSRIIARCRDIYDYIFIDAPPCMFIADPLVIGQDCDGVIFVTACGSTKIEAIRISLSQLEQTNIRVVGILLNKFSREHASYGYCNYYNYYYYYSNHYNTAGELPAAAAAEQTEAAGDGGAEQEKDA